MDRPPVSLWYHFGVQHTGGERIAEISLEYFKAYDFDWLKLMNDYFYPFPEDLEGIKTSEDLKRIKPFDIEKSIWKEQLKAIEIIAAELKRKAYFTDTVFDAWQTFRRTLAGENLKWLMDNEPEALLEALVIVNNNLIAYCKRSLSLGAAGIFLSISPSYEIMTREQFLKFQKPFAVKLLKEISSIGKMNTAHIHGDDLYFDEVLDLPVAILSWWDRGSNGPSLEFVKENFRGCVMGGIDQKLVSRNTLGWLKNHVREGINLGGRKRFFLANGCSIDTWLYPGSVRAVVDTAKENYNFLPHTN